MTDKMTAEALRQQAELHNIASMYAAEGGSSPNQTALIHFLCLRDAYRKLAEEAEEAEAVTRNLMYSAASRQRQDGEGW